MKWVKQKASTVNKRREIEMALEKGRTRRTTGELTSSSVGEEEVMQGLYAERQTELYVPEPVIGVRCAIGSRLHP
jgi:xeroderma pigmentosum group C-complementing protein